MVSPTQNRQSNRWGTWVFSFLTILFLSPQLASAINVTGPNLSVGSVSGAPGSTVSVSVIANFTVAVNSMQFNLQFDPNLLTVSSVAAGSATSTWTVVKNTNTSGTVVVGMFNTGGSASSISGSQQQIALINFTINNPPGDSSTSSALTPSSVTFDSTAVTQLTAGTCTLNVPPVDYTLTVNISGNGTVSENPDSASYVSGSQVVLTASPSSGYQFSSWGGGASGSANPLTLTMNADTSVVANFSVQTETVSASAGTGGTISPSGSVSVNYGANQTFTVTPNAGYTASLTVDGTAVTLTNNTYTLTDVTASHTVAASFSLQNETVTASSGTGGTISPSGSVSVAYGASQKFILTPNAGYSASLTVDGSAVTLTNNTYTLSDMTASHTVVANFTLGTETITASAGTSGAISPSGSVVVNYGANQTFTVTPNAGYTATLTVDGAAVTLTNNAYTLSDVTASHTVAASFSLQNETITASAGANGTISPSGSVSVTYGASQKFTLTPNAGYSASLTVDGSAVTLTNNTYTLSDVTASHTVAASFTLGTETVTASAGTSGAISPSGSVVVNYGANQTFTVTPNAGYTASLTVDGTAVTLTNNAYTLSDVITSHTVAASFTLNAETITASAGTGGTISPSGAISVSYGANQTFTVTPNAGYTASLMVDGTAVTLTNNAYTLNDVTASHTVAASFSLQNETITASAGANGTISPSGSVSVAYGTSQKFTLTPNAGYSASLTVDGAAVTLTNNTYTLNNVTTSHTVAASFTLGTETITASAGAGGTISPSGSVVVNYGANQTFAVTPNAGYTATLTVDGAAVTLTNNAYTLNDVTTSHTVAASFSLQNETITASAGTGGAISPSGSVNVAYGSSQKFTLTPNAGYSASLTVDGSAVTLTNNTYTLSDVTASHTVAASFTLGTEIIIASFGTGGAISPSGSVSVAYGTSQKFTLTPNAGYTASLTVDGTAVTLTNNTYTLSNVTASHTVAASFTLGTETVTASAGTSGAISPSGSVVVNYGANQTFTVTPNAGYTASLTVDGTAVTLTNNAYTLSNVTASHTVAASFSLQNETITASAGANGTISPSGSVSVTYGASQKFTVTPSTGYTASLTVDGASVMLANNMYTLSDITAAHTVVATFSVQIVTPSKAEIIKASAGTGGKISPSGQVNVSYGANQIFTVSPNKGYTAKITVDGKMAALTNNVYTFKDVTSAHTIAVSFTAIKIDIIAIAREGGRISPSNMVSVNYGANQVFTLTPNHGYAASLTVDGKVVTLTQNAYTLSDVTNAHILVATFKPTSATASVNRQYDFR